ncbi:MAG TPA: EamA family transporter [Rhizomicrobium sp.]|nr:EamA family transporter [Rhizomicrobium sp.]
MRGLGFVIAIVAGTLFGVGGTFAQFLFQQRGVDIGWLVTMRLLFGGAMLLLISAAVQHRAMLTIWRQDWAALLLFGLIGMMPVQYTYMAAIGASNTATATVLQFTSPAMVALWLAATRQKRSNVRDVAAVALAMLGTFFLVAHGRFGALSISLAALFWGLASAVAAAFNSLQPAGLLKRHGAAMVAGWGMLIGGVALSFLHAPWKVQGLWDGRAYGFFAFVLIFGTLLAFYLFNMALRMIGPQKTILLTCAEPLSAAVLSVWWLGLSWGVMDWLGTLCILITIALLAGEQSEESQAEKVT